MSFDKIKENRAESARFMVDEITNVLQKTRKTRPRSEGEKKGRRVYGDSLNHTPTISKWNRSTVFRPFMGWIYISVSLYIIGLLHTFSAGCDTDFVYRCNSNLVCNSYYI